MPETVCPFGSVTVAVRAARGARLSVGVAGGPLIAGLAENCPAFFFYPAHLDRMPGTWEPEGAWAAAWDWCFVRDAPAADMIRLLLNEGATVHGYDPEAMPKMAALLPDATYFESPYDAARDCDAAILATEWEDFAQLDLARLRSLMARPVFIDGRHFFSPADLVDAGFHVAGGKSADPTPERLPMGVVS